MTMNVCMMISSTIHMHTGMRHKQLKADEEDRRRLAEDEREWKFWIAFWNKVCFDVVFAGAHVHITFHALQDTDILAHIGSAAKSR